MKRIGIVFLSWLLLCLPMSFAIAKNNPSDFVVARKKMKVKITSSKQNWVQTIFICNTSANAIPLTDIELSFNYAAPMPTTIWGKPWANWRVATQTGRVVTLLGGTPQTPALPSDPHCMTPMTVEFTSAPTDPQVTSPYAFKAAIDNTPTIPGKLNVNLSAMPAAGINNPELKVQGPSGTQNKIVTWGSQWQLVNLTAGSYTVTAPPVDNGTDFFEALPVTVTVSENNTSTATVNYRAVVSGQVTVTLINAPQSPITATFTGQKYTFQKSLVNGMSIKMPADTYQVTAAIPGYSLTIAPNPLVVPTNTSLVLTYQQVKPLIGPRLVGYYESWASDSQTTDGTKTNLANLPKYITMVNLAFVKPDASYQKASLNLAGTGLEFNYTGTVLKQAITHLHQRNPDSKVLVAVGGAAYNNWGTLNARAIADLISDIGADGVDIDYEPLQTGCALGTDNRIHCQIDTAFQGFVQSLRTALPRPYILTVTGYSVAAYGEDQWRNTPPISQYTGMMLPLLRSTAASSIDLVNVMSYDAGTTFDPLQALAAYSNYYKGLINMGVEVPPESAGGHVYTLCDTISLTQAVLTNATQKNSYPGMMLWSLQKKPTGAVTPNNPSAQMMATTICKQLGLTNCNEVLLINGIKQNNIDVNNLMCQ